MNRLSEMIMRHGPPIGDVVEHYKREAEHWRQRYEALHEAFIKNAFIHTHPAVTLMAEPESFKAGEQLAERKMLQLFTDPENQPTQHGTVTVEYMQREVADKVAAERKACEDVAHEFADVKEIKNEFDRGWSRSAHHIAFTIRARSKA